MYADAGPSGHCFSGETPSIRPAVKLAVAELESFLDTDRVAAWFREPNLWLGNRRPVELVVTSPGCVLGAARADRCIASGLSVARRPGGT
jgi:uncharacterized protein (DUF2384 family)